MFVLCMGPDHVWSRHQNLFDFERFGPLTSGLREAIFQIFEYYPLLSERRVGIPICVHFPFRTIDRIRVSSPALLQLYLDYHAFFVGEGGASYVVVRISPSPANSPCYSGRDDKSLWCARGIACILQHVHILPYNRCMFLAIQNSRKHPTLSTDRTIRCAFYSLVGVGEVIQQQCRPARSYILKSPDVWWCNILLP